MTTPSTTKSVEEDGEIISPGTAATKIPAPSQDEFTKNRPVALPSPPFITIEGVPNFRDMGGYSCPPPPPEEDSNIATTAPSGPYHVRTGFLYRCATLSQITATGCETLTSDLGISTLYDLRSYPEVSRPGAVPSIPKLTRHFTPVYKAEDYSPEALATKYSWYTAADESPEDGYSRGFVKAYRDIAAHGARNAYRLVFEHVRDGQCSIDAKSDSISTSVNPQPQTPTSIDSSASPHPLIFHCTAGKDRTGVLAALLLKLCGVSDETIAWEYSITEPGMGAWREEIVQRMMKGNTLNNVAPSLPSASDSFPSLGTSKKPNENLNNNSSSTTNKSQILIGGGSKGMPRAQANRISGSRASNMRRFLTEVLEGEYGGVEAYLTRACGFSVEDVRRIHRNLVVAGEAPARPVEIEGWDGVGMGDGGEGKS